MDEIKVGDTVWGYNIENQGVVVAIIEDKAWVKWGGGGNTVWPTGNLKKVKPKVKVYCFAAHNPRTGNVWIYDYTSEEKMGESRQRFSEVGYVILETFEKEYEI